jgi:hypothetical protein
VTLLNVLKISAPSIDASHWEWQREQELRRARNPQTSAKSSGTDSKSTSNDSSTARASDSKKKKKKKGSRGNRGNSGGSSDQTLSSLTSEKPYTKVIGSDGKLLPAEKACQITKTLCLLCESREHRSNECPKKKPAAGCAATTDLASASAPAPVISQ